MFNHIGMRGLQQAWRCLSAAMHFPTAASHKLFSKSSEDKVNFGAENAQNNIAKGGSDQKLIIVTLQHVRPKNKGPVAERQRAAGLN